MQFTEISCWDNSLPSDFVSAITPAFAELWGGGIVSIAATLQYSMTIPNFLIMEHSEQGHAVKSMILSENFDAKQGTYNSPIKPGLGIEIDENKLEKYKIKPSL